MGDTAMDRRPAGLTAPLFVGGASLAAMVACWRLGWPGERGGPLLVHVGAGLSLIWVLTASAVGGHGRGAAPGASRKGLASIVQMGALGMGVIAAVLMLYAAVTEGIFRTLLYEHQQTPQLNLWRTGFVDLALLACAVLISWHHNRNGELVTVLFWLCVLGGLWLAFQVPASRPEAEVRGEYAVMTRWPALFMGGSAAAIAAFTWAGGVRHRSRRARAWPDRLSLLAGPARDWPGFRYSAGLMGAAVLFLGCVYLLVPWTGPAALLAGIAMLALASRRWNENLAEVGLALITLGVVSLVMVPFGRARWWSPGDWAAVFNHVMLGLALMTAVWYWLAGVWWQQLDEGRAWTTAGRLIWPAQRVGYLAGAAGLLVSFHVSFWPRFPFVPGLDNAPERWFWGLVSNGSLALALTFAALRTRRPTQAWLVLFTLGSTAAFAVVRLPDSALGEAWLSCWPVLLVSVAALMVAASVLAGRSPRWSPFREPTYLTGVVIAPLTAMAGVLFERAFLMPPWVPAATFGGLAGVYALAAWAPGPRTFLAVSVLCGVVGGWRLRAPGSWATIAPVYFYITLCGLSAALLALLSQQRKPTGAARFVKWAAGSLAFISLVVGWIVSRG